jgi:hypothetical protein
MLNQAKYAAKKLIKVRGEPTQKKQHRFQCCFSNILSGINDPLLRDIFCISFRFHKDKDRWAMFYFHYVLALAFVEVLVAVLRHR